MSGQQQAAFMPPCPDRPGFHLQSSIGWINDPNGPVFYRGRYHMFYQHLPHTCAWDFGIVWGHAVSSDLVHWEHLPPALVPTPGWADADGCFSGSCVIDYDGRPVILYTGVRLRSNPECGPLPEPEHDLGLVFIESQILAVPEDPDDDLLIRWRKLDPPFIPLPPSHITLTGWRDPFIYRTHASSPEKNGFVEEYRMLIGSGIKGQGGTALVYRSHSLFEGWELVGQLCNGNSNETGFVWECPIVLPLDSVPPGLEPSHRRHPPRWLIDREASLEALPPLQVLDSFQRLRVGRRGSSGGSGSWRRLEAARKPSWSSVQEGEGEGVPEGPSSPPSLPPSPFHAPDPTAREEEGRKVDGSGEGPSQKGGLRRRNSFGFSLTASPDEQPGSPISPAMVGATAAKAAVETASSAADAVVSTTARAAAAVGAAVRQLTLADLPEGSPALAPARRPRSPEMERAYTLETWRAGGGGAEGEGEGVARGDSEDASSEASFEFAPSMSSPRDLPSSFTSTAATSPAIRPSPGDNSVPGLSLALGAEARGGGGGALPPSAPMGIPRRDGANPGEKQQRESRGSLSREQPPPGAARPGLPPSGSFDTVAAAISRMPRIKPKASIKSSMGSLGRLHQGSQDRLANKWGSAASLSPQAKQAQQAQQHWHLFTVSPDAPTNPVLYWIGRVDETGYQFQLEEASGPFRLDLGDVLYAPNVMQDDQGRWLLWGWIQERRKVGSYGYSGCMTLPRVLHVTAEGRLIQAPAPELRLLRTGHTWQAQHMPLPPNVVTPIPSVNGLALDIECSIERGSATAVGLLFRSWHAEAEGGTAIIYDWERGVLEAIFNVPPSYGASVQSMGGAGGEEGGGDLPLDPGSLLSPRLMRSSSSLGMRGGISRSSSMASLQGGAGLLSSSFNRSTLLSRGSLRGSFREEDLSDPSRIPPGGAFSPRSPSSRAFAGGLDLDEDLDTLLEELSEPMRPSEAPPEHQEVRRVGGPLSMKPTEALHLRVFVDRSCVEVYTGSGEVLSTRVYRGEPPPGADSGIEFVAFGGVATLLRVEAHEMGSAWEHQASATQQMQQGERHPHRTSLDSVSEGVSLGSLPGGSLLTSPYQVLHPSDAVLGGGSFRSVGSLTSAAAEADLKAAPGGVRTWGSSAGQGVEEQQGSFEEIVYRMRESSGGL